jgi:isoleucyl-tRNA synthetase
VTAPQDVIKQSGADILRMWVCASDYADDLRIGPEILKTTIETYRKLRNTLRWMLGSLAHLHAEDRIALAKMPELERLMLHRLTELDRQVRQAYADFDYKRIFAALNNFMTSDLSAFYFDIRKDALYCDPISSTTRRACLSVLEHLFRCTVTWLAPMLPFSAEEAWLARYPSRQDSLPQAPGLQASGQPQPAHSDSVHLELFPDLPASWRNDGLAEKWRKVRLVRRVVTGALEVERAGKRIGSSLEAAPLVYVGDADLSAFYFDIRKDTLYCEPISSLKRKACLTVLDHLFRCTVVWLAPMLCFTAEESWLSRYGNDAKSVHLETFPEVPAAWRDDRLADKWRKVRTVRRVVTGALEIERAQKRIGSSLEAHPIVHVSNPELAETVLDVDLAEVCITSALTLVEDEGPADAFRMPDVSGVAVLPNLAEGTKCARSWRVLNTIGADPDYPDVSPRDAQALREWDALRKAAE